MKFGLWFAPQVVDSGLVGKGVKDEWVARRDGKDIRLDLGNGWAPIDQVCLGDPEVVGHLKAVMAEAVRDYRLDWLKWDNSGLPGQVCNRSDHGHRADDGALAALRGEYEIYEHLHRQFPDLVLENCGYPSRLDYGLARYARANWLSDDTSDALRCRRSQIHGSHVLPAARNTAWVIGRGEMASEKDPDVLDTIIRSRMIGLFGMGTLTGTLAERLSLCSPAAKDALRRNIAGYKRYRHLLSADVYHVLPLASTPQEWDGIEFCRRDGSEAVVLVFRGTSPDAEKTVRLRGLKSGSEYTLTSFDTGKSRRAAGSTLAETGLAISLPKPNASEILLMTAN
jgi:alpha-galactosidase